MMLGAAGAQARLAYVTNSAEGTVSAIETSSGGVVATVPVGAEPVDVAISPDGSRAYVANRADGTISVIDTGQNVTMGDPIEVGAEPRGLAVTPDGGRLYVSNSGDDTVSVLSTSGAVLAPPIEVGDEPDGVAIAPNGRLAFVAQRGGGIAVVDLGSDAVIQTIPDALGPSRIAIGPRGGRAFVTNAGASSVSAFNPINLSLLGAPIASGSSPAGIAIDPGGAVAYAASPTDGTLTAIDTSLDSVLGAPLGGFPGATGIAFEPRGLTAYVTDGSGASATILDATRNAPAGAISLGGAPTGVAVVPNQGPRAELFISPTRRRAKKRLTFHASGSTDPDGSIATYLWDFGDGRHAEGPAPTRVFRYRRPGTYQVSLLVKDDEGCSTEFIFTGQTAHCNGSAAAALTTTINVLPAKGPRLRLRGARRQRLGGRVKVFAHCVGRPCSYRARGVVVTKIERFSLNRRSRHRLVRFDTVRFSRGWRRLALRLPKRTRRAAARALRHGGTAKARLTVLATDRTGDQSVATRKVKLVLPR
jgi:YVTN family beta-propeller protein